jgi:HEAT repeat protein
MNARTLTIVALSGLAGGMALYAGHALGQAAPPASTPQGTAVVYGGIAPDQIERLTPPDRIKSTALSALAGGSPMAVWQALEHGEKIDCLDCIPAVEELLYYKPGPSESLTSSAKNREIAAWWLRRRVFGVFGKGEVYERVVNTLQTDPDEHRRAYAAEALGEFLEGAGISKVASALVKDGSPVVRAAAARALDRLNDVGPNGELSKALGDADEAVRIAAVGAALHIHGFADAAAVAQRLGDSSPVVRRHAAAVLGKMRAPNAVSTLISLTSPANESDAKVRAEAVNALGLIGDKVAVSAVLNAKSDTDPFVRDAAAIASRRL